MDIKNTLEELYKERRVLKEKLYFCEGNIEEYERRLVQAERESTWKEFIKSCIEDPEFNMGGIPREENKFLQLLELDKDSQALSDFYGAMCILYHLWKRG